ncbi:hypothetical protein CBL_09008 [Carabus blaptoides fortunei]
MQALDQHQTGRVLLQVYTFGNELRLNGEALNDRDRMTCSDTELQHNDTQSKDPIPNGKYASPEGRFELRAGSESSQSRELTWLFAHKNVCVYVKPMLFGIARMPNISSPRNIQARHPANTGSDTKHRRNDHNAHHTVSTGFNFKHHKRQTLRKVNTLPATSKTCKNNDAKQ